MDFNLHRRSGNSYKKAVYKDRYGSPSKKWEKRQASKAVRRYKGPIPEGGAYKSIYESWNIADFSFDSAHKDPVRWHEVHFEFGDKNYISK